MARLRYNALKTGAAGSGVALALGASLTNSGTSITFNAALTYNNGTAVPTIVSPDYIPLEILDASGNMLEVVYLTAYTAAATTGTISRGKEGTAGVAHSSGDKIVAGVLASDVVNGGSVDFPPPSPNAKDDEFDGSSSVSWTSTPTAPNAWDINSTRPSHAYLKTSGAGAAYVGKYQAVPGSYPYTITVKFTGSTARALYQRAGGILLAPASPTNSSNVVYFGDFWNSAETGNGGGHVVSRQATTLGGSFGSIGSKMFMGVGPIYLRVTVASATSVAFWASPDGWAWTPGEQTYNPGFTPGVMGLVMNDDTANSGVEAYFDFFRVT